MENLEPAGESLPARASLSSSREGSLLAGGEPLLLPPPAFRESAPAARTGLYSRQNAANVHFSQPDS